MRCVHNRQRYDPRTALIARAVLRWLVYAEIGAGWIEARKKEVPIQHGRRTGTIGCVENVARHRKKDRALGIIDETTDRSLDRDCPLFHDYKSRSRMRMPAAVTPWRK